MAVVTAPTVTAPRTSRTPRMAAASGRRGSAARSVSMFSATIRASSTTRPTTRKNAEMVTTLMVRPRGAMSVSEPTKASGMPSATHTATRRSRTRIRRTNTSTTPITTLRRMVRIRFTARPAVSSQTDTVTSGGGEYAASHSRTSAATSVSDCQSATPTVTSNAGMPLTVRTTRSSGAKASRISATSPNRMIVPSALVTRGMSANCAPLCRLDTMWSATCPDSVSSSPNDRLSEERCTRVAIVSNESP